MSGTRVHDLLGIGVGPFNLGLAALSAPLDDLDAVFLEAKESFSWHPGLLLDGATIQVPFLADLVTMADPTSEYSFLSWLKRTGRLYRFYIRENFLPLRAEYDAYCRWAADRLPSVRFGHHVESVSHDGPGDCYEVRAVTPDGHRETLLTRRLVLGIGTEPRVPDALAPLLTGDPPVPVLHSSEYLHRRDELRSAPAVTVVGSGQSAAEVYLDLLRQLAPGGTRVHWITRSPRYFPMEYTKLTLEMTSPEYVSYFHALPGDTRRSLLREQRTLYKGISSVTIEEVFEELYRLDVAGHRPGTLLTATEVTGARAGTDAVTLDLHQWEQERTGTHVTQALVLATGYHPRVPAFLDGVRDRIRFAEDGSLDVARGYTIDHDDREIFVQNAEEHTHGLAAPDLGMGAYRNSVILNAVLGKEVYPVEERIAFQQFGLPA